MPGRNWLAVSDTAGAILGLVYGGASIVLAFAGPGDMAALLLACMLPLAGAAAWGGWRRHRRGRVIAAFALAAGAATLGWLYGIGTVIGTVAAAGGGLALAATHDANRLLCRRAAVTPVPVSILTGFLGSGKTTVLNHLLAQEGMASTAVIINEFGEVGIDHLLVENVDERMMRLASGCLCCTIRGDLLQTLQDIFSKVARGDIPPVDRVLVETTGLADPAPILHALMAAPAALQRCRLDTIITTVDAVNGLRTLDRHREAVQQVAVADRVLLTKTDLQHDADVLRARIRALNPAAPIIEVTHGHAEAAALLGGGMHTLLDRSPDVLAWLNPSAYAGQDHGHGGDRGHGHHHDVNRHDDEIYAYCIVREEPIRTSAFEELLALLTAEHGDDLLRVKGILHLQEKPGTPALIHGVQHVFHPVRWLARWPGDDRRSRLVFITRGIPRERLDRLLAALERSAAPLP